MRAHAQAQLTRQPIGNQRESRVGFGHVMRRGFRPALLWRAIIMPPFMLRPSPFPLLLICVRRMHAGGLAADPPCPSQLTRRSAPAGASPLPPAPRGRGRQVAVRHRKIDRGDTATWGRRQGDAQGQRGGAPGRSARSAPTRCSTIKHHQCHPDRRAHRLPGSAGARDRGGRQLFGRHGRRVHSARSSTCTQRSARGTAQEMALTPEGVLDLRG